MPLDPRSRERLAALGRTLPQPLPTPEAPRSPRMEAAMPRHAVETEDNPEQLFRELMRASADGTVPPHLLDRLRQLEKQRLRLQSRPNAAAGAPAAVHPAASGNLSPGAASVPPGARRRPGGGRRPGVATAGSEEAELYTAFAQLLLEDEELS